MKEKEFDTEEMRRIADRVNEAMHMTFGTEGRVPCCYVGDDVNYLHKAFFEEAHPGYVAAAEIYTGTKNTYNVIMIPTLYETLWELVEMVRYKEKETE